jgi:hypothetical protein
MRLITTVTLAAALFASAIGAYGQASGQANASASSGASAQAGGPGAQVSSGNSASSSAQAGQNSANLSSGTALNAALSQPLDAKKNKPGDPVTARTMESTKSEGKVVVPKGSKLVGHVTEAKARTKGESDSTLGIVFDKAILKNGQEIPLNVSVQAIAVAQTTAASSLAGDDLSAGGGAIGGASGRASGGALGGVRSTAGAATGTVSNTAANVGGVAGGTAGGAISSTTNAAAATRGSGLNAAGRLTSSSQGVFGLDGVNLTSGASNSTQGALITSASKNVHLDSGTQLLLVSQGQASGPASKQ